MSSDASSAWAGAMREIVPYGAAEFMTDNISEIAASLLVLHHEKVPLIAYVPHLGVATVEDVVQESPASVVMSTSAGPLGLEAPIRLHAVFMRELPEQSFLWCKGRFLTSWPVSVNTVVLASQGSAIADLRLQLPSMMTADDVRAAIVRHCGN